MHSLSSFKHRGSTYASSTLHHLAHPTIFLSPVSPTSHPSLHQQPQPHFLSPPPSFSPLFPLPLLPLPLLPTQKLTLLLNQHLSRMPNIQHHQRDRHRCQIKNIRVSLMRPELVGQTRSCAGGEFGYSEEDTELCSQYYQSYVLAKFSIVRVRKAGERARERHIVIKSSTA